MIGLADVDEIAKEHGFKQTAAADVSPGLGNALASLLKRDAVLVARGAAERAICHRLAVYLECAVNQGCRDGERWDVDCEYNLFGSSAEGTEGRKFSALRKWMQVEGITDERGTESRHCVYPDIIVHCRDTTTNLLVIEMKVLRSTTRPIDIAFDLRKLIVFHRPGDGFAYKGAALVLILPKDKELDGNAAQAVVYARPPNAQDLDITKRLSGEKSVRELAR